MKYSRTKVARSITAGVMACALSAGLGLPAFAVNPASVELPSNAVKVVAAPNDAKNAPSSKFIKKVTETKTTSNLHLRDKASGSGKSLGIMPKGSVVKLTGKKSGTWSQLTWKGKTGWAATQYLSTKTVTKDESVRYINSYITMHSGRNYTSPVAGVHFRTKVTLLEVYGAWSQIKTSSYFGWIPSSRLSKTQPAKAYRYVRASGPTYSLADKAKGKTVGRIHHAEKYEHRRWDYVNRRDEILVNGKWVWTSTTGPAQVIPSYRYAQRNGTTYNTADKASSNKVGTITRGAKVRWGAWDPVNRRDEVLVNGKWVWSPDTAPNMPAGVVPKTTAVDPYARFASTNLVLRKTPRSNPYDTALTTVKSGDKVTVTGTADGGWVRVKYGNQTGYIKESSYLKRDSPYSVAVYGTLRTGEKAYNLMGGYQQKVMNQRFAQSSLYQLWQPNLTFLTNGSGKVVSEQFQYSASKGPAMLKKLDIYEGSVKYGGKPMYTRQKVSMTDGSQSWAYKTNKESEKIVKKSGRYISSGDFLKRS